MDNIVSVKLDSRYAPTLGGVWQYDYGQALRITGPEFPPALSIRYLPHTQAKIHERHRMHRLCSPRCLYRTLTRFQSGNSRTVRIHTARAIRLHIMARHGRTPRITTSGSRVCMDGKRCTQTNHWQTFPSAV